MTALLKLSASISPLALADIDGTGQRSGNGGCQGAARSALQEDVVPWGT
jgi:hypothetical protein